MKDIDLIAPARKVKKNNPETFETFVDLYYSKVHYFCSRIIGSEDECIKIIEKVFVLFWEKQSQNKSKPLSFLLYEILKHEVFLNLQSKIRGEAS